MIGDIKVKQIAWTVFSGILLILLGAGEEVTCLRGSAVVLQAKVKAAEVKDAPVLEDAALLVADGNSTSSNSTVPTNTTTSSSKKLTGIPQKDYILDPNLPRELNGHNLTDYPFYNAIPEDIDFNCDGLHDGFYASVPHKCQVYHHCLFGTRYDFLCANYTAFDQKTFICHFVSEIDCDNSPKYYKRNEALYKAATSPPPLTTTTAKPLTTTVAPTEAALPPAGSNPRGRPLGPPRNRYNKPYRNRRPYYAYYYDDEYDDSDYYEDDFVQAPRRLPGRRTPQGGVPRNEDPDLDTQPQQANTDMVKPSVRPNNLGASSVFDRPRVPPKVRRPVPINERDKYDYSPKPSGTASSTTENIKESQYQQNSKRPPAEDDYYYDEEEYENEQRKYKNVKQSDRDVGPKGPADHRPLNRHRLRVQNRKRPDRYDEDDYYEEDLPRMRKGQRYNNNPRSSRPRSNRGKGYQKDDEAVAAERPGYISTGRTGDLHNRKRTHNGEYTRNSGKKLKERRPVYDYDDDEYYDYEEDDVEEEKPVRKNRKPPGRYNERRDEDIYENPRSNKRKKLNNGESSSPKAGPTDKLGEDGDRSINQNDKTLINQRNSNFRSVANKNLNNQRSQTNNKKTPPLKVQNPESEEKFDDDEEYEDDYITLNPSKVQTNNENINTKPKVENNNQQNIRPKETTTDESTQKNYKYTTFPSTSERTNSYVRNPSIYRSRTSSTPLIEDVKSSTVSTLTTNHRFSSTSKYNEDYQDQEEPQYFHNKPENRTRTTLFSNNNRKNSTYTSPKSDEKSESSLNNNYKDSSEENNNNSKEKSVRDSTLNQQDNSGASRSVVSVGLFRRPVKLTTSNVIETTTILDYNQNSPQSISQGGYFRRNQKPVEPDDSRQNETPVPVSNYREPFNRGKNRGGEVDKNSTPTAITETESVPTQQFNGMLPNSNRKPIKPTDRQPTDYNYNARPYDDKPSLNVPTAPGSNMKQQEINDYSSSEYETRKPAPVPPSGPGSGYRKLKVVRPTENKSTENTQFSQEDSKSVPLNEAPLKSEEISGVNYKSQYRYPNSAAPKQSGNRNFPTAPDSYPKTPSKNIIENTNSAEFSNQPGNIDVTAPGPSAPGSLNQNMRNNLKMNDFSNNNNNNQKNQPLPNFDIPEEEYDVTLNDALQPSTLHPTRSHADYQQPRVKIRGFLSMVPHPLGANHNRGLSTYLSSTSSSEQQPNNNQNIGFHDMQLNYAETQGRKKDVNNPADEESSYEAVVLAAPQFSNGGLQRWSNQRQSTPQEWYW